MEIYFTTLIFLMGLCVGSFVNMAVYRYSARNKLISYELRVKRKNNNRSFCDFCGRQLRWYENIPVLSWIFLGGKTKCCGKNLSKLYPVVELGMGILFVINYQLRVESYELKDLLGFILLALMVFSLVVDLKYMILPDEATVAMIIGALLINSLTGLVAGLGAMGFMGLIYFLTKGKGMGFGDVKLALFMGLLLGFPNIMVAFYVAFVVGAIVGVILLVSKIVRRRSPIPFGPFLFLGTVVAWWGGEAIINNFKF